MPTHAPTLFKRLLTMDNGAGHRSRGRQAALGRDGTGCIDSARVGQRGCSVSGNTFDGSHGRTAFTYHQPSSVALHKRSKTLVPRSPGAAASLITPMPSRNRPSTPYQSVCGACHHGMSTTAQLACCTRSRLHPPYSCRPCYLYVCYPFSRLRTKGGKYTRESGGIPLFD